MIGTNRIAVAMLTFVVAAPLHAQTTIRVLDRDSVPIPYALVLIGSTPGRAADQSGVVRLSEGPRGAFDLRVQRIGYEPFQRKMPAPEAGGEIIVRLSRLAAGMDTVRSIAERETSVSRTGFYDRMARVRNGAMTADFITPEELTMRNPGKLTDILRGRQTVSISRHPTDPNGRMIAFGRGGSCNMTVLLDGVRVNGLLENAGSGVPTSMKGHNNSGSDPRSARENDATAVGFDEVTDIASVMAIEVYPSTANAPAELIPLTGGGSCGIIALWTGPRR